MKKLLQVLIISASLLTVAACSTTNPNGADVTDGTATDMSSSADDDSGAMASGAGDTDNFGGNGSAMDAKKMQVANQSYYFDFNKYDVHSADLPSIKVQADYLAIHANAHVLLAGNTDERGSREYNIALGNKRAQSVSQQLQADGVNPNEISTVSYGAEKPKATGHDAAAWAQNRRVDLTYQTPIKKLKKADSDDN